MARITVDSEALEQARGQMNATIARIRADADSINAQLQQLSGSWTGQASVAFLGVLSEWRGTQTQINESFDSIGQAVGAASAQYLEVEQANARMFAR